MKNLRNKNQPPNADLVQVYLQSSWDIVTAVYAELDSIQTISDAIDQGGLDFLTAADIDTLAELNAIITDATLGRFATQGEAEAGTDNTVTMTPLRVAQAIATQVNQLQNNWNASAPPGLTDDVNAGYSVGSVWLDTTAEPDEAYRCTDPAAGAAKWIKTSLTADELATVALSGDSDDLTEGVVKLLMTTTERSKLTGIEDSATTDQSDSEIKTAYENLTTLVSQVEAEAGIGTTIRTWTAERVGQAITALSGSGGMTWNNQGDTNFNIVADNGYVTDGLTADRTASLPTSPAVGDTAIIWNNDGTVGFPHHISVDPGGSNELISRNVTVVGPIQVNPGEFVQVVCFDAGATKRWHYITVVDQFLVGGGGMPPAEVKIANYTAVSNEVVPVDTSGGAFTITLPASPSAQDRIIIDDRGKSCGTTNCTIARNGKTIDGVAEDFIIDQDSGRVDLVYDGISDWDTHLIGFPEIPVPGGTFAPTLLDSTLSDAEGQTYTEQTGVYRLVGDVCFFWLEMIVNSLGTLTTGDNASIGGLPYTAKAIGCHSPVAVGVGASLAITAGNTISGAVLESNDHISLQKWSATTGTVAMTVAEVSTGGRLVISGNYVVA